MGDGVALLETGVGWSLEERVEDLEGLEGLEGEEGEEGRCA